MKILHFLGSTSIGGVAAIVYELSKYAIEQGHNVDILSMCKDPYLIDSSGKFESLGVRTFISDTNRRYDLRQLVNLRRKIKNYDIIHVHQFPEQLYGALVNLLKGKKRCPYVITTEHNTWNNRRNYKLLKSFDKWMYSLYNKIVCISPSTEIELKKWISSPKINNSILTITNGIDIDKYANARDCLSNFVRKNHDDIFIGMVGRMEHPKDPFTLIKAISKLPKNVKAIFMGDGNLKDKVRLLVNELNLNDRVFLLGNVPDVSGILKGCHIGVLSTHWDGFGLVAAEYMASGIPAVVSDVEGLKDVVGDPDLWFKPQDDTRLAQIINRLITDKNFYESKVSNGRKRVRQFSQNEMGKKYLELYSELINSK